MTLRDEALEQMEITGKEFLEIIRPIARRIAREKGRVSVNDLRPVATRDGIIPPHPNVWGAVFKGGGWYQVGWTLARLPASRARAVRVWSLDPPEKLRYLPPQRAEKHRTFVIPKGEEK